MKLLINLIFAISLIAFVACSESGQSTSSQNTIEPNGSEQLEQIANIDIDAVNAELDRVFAEHNARIAKVGNMKAKKGDISVPSDFSTIQAAVDAAVEGTNIRVHAGNYSGHVVVNTAGVEIKAVGEVTLNGRFTVFADDVSIRNFNIVVGNRNIGFNGIAVRNANGIEAKNNTVTDAYVGIFLIRSDNSSVKNNDTYENRWGIALHNSHDNSVRNNTSHENFVNGMHSQDGSSGNEVKGNKCNDNNNWGMVFNATTNNNSVGENEALNNGTCDILDAGTDNTFQNNNADCTSGL